MQYRIRPVEEDDLPCLVDLCREHAAYEEAAFLENGQAERLKLALFAAVPQVECLVVVWESEFLGYASFMPQFSTWDAAHYLHLDCLFLRPHARNLGIGRELMGRIQAIARERNYSHIQWQTPVFNADAIRFYECLGAVSKAKQRFFWNT